MREKREARSRSGEAAGRRAHPDAWANVGKTVEGEGPGRRGRRTSIAGQTLLPTETLLKLV